MDVSTESTESKSEQEITLTTLPSKTAQEVFDYIVKHLRKQNKKAIGDEISSYSCVYRKENPETHEIVTCAAGCLIAPEEYRKNFEGISWGALTQRNLVPNTYRNLIINLQNIHDCYEVKNWEEQFSLVATRFQLNFTLLT